jgi:FkbM family methyltransferase
MKLAFSLLKQYFKKEKNHKHFFGFYKKIILKNPRIFQRKLTGQAFNANFKLNLFDWIQSQVYFTGTYLNEHKALLKMIHLSKKKTVFWDIGANFGLYTILLAKSNPNLKVISFEPIPNNIDNLKTNLQLNKLNNVLVVEKALSEKSNGSFDIYLPSNENLGLASFVPFKENQGKLTIPITSGDAFLQENQNLAPDLIKIDTEGYELSILKGLSNTIKEFNPLIAIEWEPEIMKRANTKPQEFLDFFQKHNYNISVEPYGAKLTIAELQQDYPLLFAFPNV